MTARLPDVVLYGRSGCGLCDEARETLRLLIAERASLGLTVPVVVEHDIAADPDLERALFDRIPVVEIGDARLELSSSPAKVRRLLASALDTEPATAR